MCLVLFAYHAHPTYKLIVAANRDEFYQRPTAAADYWEDEPHILAGRDLDKMGTWMGITKNGRFAALTNYRNPQENTKGKHSRGELVADFLKDNGHPEGFMQHAANKRALYPGYNLLAGTAEDLYYYANIGNEIHRVQPGIHGLSNHILNTEWPKVKRGKEGLAKIINDPSGIKEAGNTESLVAQLFTLLQNTEPVSDELLPKTGIPHDLEKMLSTLFIKSEEYGTRSSTVLLMGDNETHYIERVYSHTGIRSKEFLISK